MARDLPSPVEEAGLLFQRASVIGDPEAMQRIIAWGHQQIDVAYPEDPIRAPLNVIRRLRAHQEWERVVRTTGKELCGTIMSSIVRDLEFEISRRQEDIRARDAEARRQEAVIFDAQVRAREQVMVANLSNQIAKEQMRLQHQLDQQAAENDSRRRMTERTHETNQQITEQLAQVIVRAMGSNPTDSMLDAAKKIGEEIANIRANPAYTDDDKHLQIQILLQSLPRLFNDLRASDV